MIDRRPFDETPAELRARRERAMERRIDAVRGLMRLEEARSTRRAQTLRLVQPTRKSA